MFPKDNPWRSRKYLEWVKSLPSVVSRIEPAGMHTIRKVTGSGER